MFNSKIISTLILLLTLSTTRAAEPPTEPILRIETGMHTAMITRISVDTAERFLLTASHDKTLRLWDLLTGNLLKIYRVPIGAGNEGKLYSGAISPDGEWVAGAGWTAWEWDNKNSIYLFNRASGKLVKRLSGLEEVISHLCFSPDGQYLGASLGGANGVRVWDTQTWSQIFSDTDYADSYWCDFDQQNRLVTSALDGYLRLYSSTSDRFSLVAKSDAPGGKSPSTAVFSPTGDKIAVGFFDFANVNVLDGHDLAFLYALDTTGIDNGSLNSVAWSQDGNNLYAGGMYNDGIGAPILHWSQAGQKNYTEWQASLQTIMDIRPLKNGNIVYGAADPAFAILDNEGIKIIERETNIVDHRRMLFRKGLRISHDGNTIQFEYDERLAHFSLFEQNLIFLNLHQATNLKTPDTTSLNITNWMNDYNPKLNGKALFLEQYEISRSLAIAPDKSKFLLGADWYLRLFDTNGQLIWRIVAPSVAWAINISGDGKKAVAAYGDGTIRWYNLENGDELLAFFPHKDGKRWIAWISSGYYMSSADNADNLIGWHVNNGKDKAASLYPAGALHTTYKRPDIVKKILETMDEKEAIRLANLEKEDEFEPLVNVDEALTKVSDKYKIKSELSGLGKAIIIAAGGAHSSNKLFSYTNDSTTEMYRFLRQIGFSDGDIIYMNPMPPVYPFNGYPDASRQDFPLRDPKTELQQAIATASQDLKSGQQFVLYLHGHARINSVQMNRTIEISAQEIKDLLAKIPSDIEQIIILDTCYSGSFMDGLSGAANRIVVTSADAETKAWSTKWASFSEFFIKMLMRGSSIGEAFEYTEDSIIGEPEFGEQRPQLDDTQDGFYDSNDGQLARRVFIGGEKVYASLPPEITETHPTIQLTEGQTTARLWVKSFPDFNGIKKVRAILVNELDEVTQYQGESTDFTRRELTLLPNYNLQRYEIEYDQFHTATNWKILYQAQSMEGDWSDINIGHVVVSENAVANTKIESHINKTTYTVGDNIQFDVTITGEGTVDLYVGVIYPQGYYQTITHPLNFSMVNVLEPYQTGVQLTEEQNMSILNIDLPAIAPGDYQVCGLLTQPQSDPNNETDWLHLDCKGFNFQ